jgi:hypothetical protein
MPASQNLHFRDSKIIVLQAAKCGTTSVSDALAPLLGVHNQSSLRRSAIPRIGPLDAFDAGNRGYLRIAICRNPFDRLVSCWRDKVIDRSHPNLLKHGVKHGMDFDAFIHAVAATRDNAGTDPHVRLQTWDWHYEGKPCWDILVPLETIEDRWEDLTTQIRAHCGTIVQPLRRLNPSKAEPPKWTPELVTLVRARYAQDFEMLSYPFDPPEPERTQGSEGKRRGRPKKVKEPTAEEAADQVAKAANTVTAEATEETRPNGAKNSVREEDLEPPAEADQAFVDAQRSAQDAAAEEARQRMKEAADG